MARPVRVHVLALPDCAPIVPVGMLDLLRKSIDLAATLPGRHPRAIAQRYPRVRLAPQAIVVDQGRVVSAGGATSFINLTLLLVERLLGQEVAWAASRLFLIDPNKSPQGAYAAFSTQKDHGDEARRVPLALRTACGPCVGAQRAASKSFSVSRSFVMLRRTIRSRSGAARR